MYPVSCVLYPKFCIPYPMLCILYHVSYILYLCILYLCILYLCILYLCILYPISCISVSCITVSLYPCILYPVAYILYPFILYPESLYPCILFPVSLYPVSCIPVSQYSCNHVSLIPLFLYTVSPYPCILYLCILYPCIPVSCIPVSSCIRYCLQPEENWKKIKDKVLRKHQQIKNQQNFIFLSWTLQKQRWDTRYILQIVHCTMCKLYSKTIFRAIFPCVQCTLYILKQMLKSLRNQQYNLKSWQTFLLVSNLKSAAGNIKGFPVATINIVSSLKGEKTKLKF